MKSSTALGILLGSLLAGVLSACRGDPTNQTLRLESAPFSSFTAYHFRHVPSGQPGEVVLLAEIANPDPKTPLNRFPVTVYDLAARTNTSWLSKSSYFMPAKLNIEFWESSERSIVCTRKQGTVAQDIQLYSAKTGELLSPTHGAVELGGIIEQTIPVGNSKVLFIVRQTKRNVEKLILYDYQIIQEIPSPTSTSASGGGLLTVSCG